MKKFTAALLGLIIAVSCLSLSGCAEFYFRIFRILAISSAVRPSDDI